MKAIVTNSVTGIGVPITDPFEALRSACAFSSRDWATEPEDAWIYGIIVGWGKGLPEVAARHGWDLDTQERLRKLHGAYTARQCHAKAKPEGVVTEPRTLAQRHQEHYRGCGCLGDSSECCNPRCECHALDA